LHFIYCLTFSLFRFLSSMQMMDVLWKSKGMLNSRKMMDLLWKCEEMLHLRKMIMLMRWLSIPRYTLASSTSS
jgi:hypothetical protein